MRRVARISITATAFALLLCGHATARVNLPGKLAADARVDGALAPPPNDTLARALPMNSTLSGTNVEATEDPDEQLTWADVDAFGCQSDGDWGTDGWPMRNTVWYWVRGTGQTISAFAEGTDIDTILAVYRSDGRFMGCSDDVVPGNANGRWSAMRFQSQLGTNYFLQVGSACADDIWGGATRCGGTRGEGEIFVSAATQPVNDNRAAAAPITLGEQTTRSLFGATEEPHENLMCDGFEFGKTRWFRVNVPDTGRLTASATSPNHDSVIGIYPAGSASRLGCNDDTAGTSSSAQVTVDVTAGAYDIQLGGFGPGLLADDLSSTVLSTSWTVVNLNKDMDGDGVNFDAGDCDDNNASVRPGATETPNNDVDENCDGVRAMDADGDGHLSGSDCNDSNRAVNPGATEIPGNRIDDDCKNGDEALRRVTSTPVIRWRFYRESSSVEVVRVEVTSLGAGTKAKIVCAGRGCPKRKSQTKTVRRATQKLRFDLRFNKKLKRSSKLTLTVTRPGYIGVVREIKVGRRQVDDRTLCLWPGERKAKRCPTDD